MSMSEKNKDVFIVVKNGVSQPIHCDKCNKKTKHYFHGEPFDTIVFLAMCFFVIGIIIALLANGRLTCSKCKNSFVWWK